TAPDFEAPGSADNSNVYEAEVTVSDGTNSVAQTITVTVTNDLSDDILSFSEAEEAAVIFPNPSGRYLEVRSSVEGTFKILSLSGKPLLEGTTNTRVDIFSLKSGLYLVQLSDGRLLKFVRK
ncbi:MAG: T9SS type A sorting domain-containing protein, partial [Ekhidna sp.]|nr:T9SS type A sorting domain-containing protein [Ekhidna sp.]